MDAPRQLPLRCGSSSRARCAGSADGHTQRGERQNVSTRRVSRNDDLSFAIPAAFGQYHPPPLLLLGLSFCPILDDACAAVSAIAMALVRVGPMVTKSLS